jgi:hypothetical protein
MANVELILSISISSVVGIYMNLTFKISSIDVCVKDMQRAIELGEIQ